MGQLHSWLLSSDAYGIFHALFDYLTKSLSPTKNPTEPFLIFNLSHARRYSQRGANCRENRQQELQDKFPSFLFHNDFDVKAYPRSPREGSLKWIREPNCEL